VVSYDDVTMADANKSEQDFNVADLPEFPEMDPTGTVDLSQIDSNLRLTPAERVARLDDFLRMMELLRQSRIQRYGFDPAIPRASETPE
jgi:hypothetical protein